MLAGNTEVPYSLSRALTLSHSHAHSHARCRTRITTRTRSRIWPNRHRHVTDTTAADWNCVNRSVVTCPDVSGLYHHDRCGHRLKAFIFLTPVTEQTHPTRVAVGSQNTQYWTYNDQTVSRLADDYVESNYHVRPMLGEIGEGFIFDTNSIHRATMVGEGGHRESLIFEFNPKAKSSFLKNSPCGNTTMG